MPYRGFLRQNSGVSVALYVAVDVCMIVLGAMCAHLLRFGAFIVSAHYRAPSLLAVVLALAIFPAFGLYDSWRGRHPIEVIRAVTFAWISTLLGLILVGFLLKESNHYSRIWVGALAFYAWLLLCTGRLTAGAALRWLRARGFNHRRVLLVGTGSTAAQVVDRVCNEPSSGWQIVGALPIDEDERYRLERVRQLHSHSHLDRLVRRLDIDEVWICLPFEEQALIDRALWQIRHCTATIRLIPTMRSINLIQHPIDEVLGFQMLNLSISPMQGINRLIKAVEDRLLASLILILASPLMAAIAIGVKLSSPGPIFFRQRRVGWNGRPFTILKFRSMPLDAEALTGPKWAQKNEHRATRFGRFLRRTSLDELPQFINVLWGNMSIVGPRPERPVFVDRFKEEIPGYMRKHLVKAGITGWAQVNGWRGNTDLQKRIEYDLYYIENWSLWFDLKIIFLTIFKGFRHENAY